MAGRYQVIRVLGRGNSSTILQAQDTFRPGLYEVAIKVLKPEYFSLGYQVCTMYIAKAVEKKPKMDFE